MNLSKDFLQRLEFVWWKKTFSELRYYCDKFPKYHQLKKGTFTMVKAWTDQMTTTLGVFKLWPVTALC